MNHLYMCNAATVKFHSSEYKIREEKPKLFKAYPGQTNSLKNRAHNLYWWFMTGGKYRVWCAYDGNNVIHTSYVIPKCSKFPFLNKGSYEIGPCHTDKKYRGKGIYPAVLSQIVSLTDGTAYMIIEEHNLPSIKGVLKVGFSLMPGYIKKDFLKRYIYKHQEE